MKISTRGRYALEAVLDLALHVSDGHESLKNISERTGISENYLEQIFAVLRKKRIVESVRGAQGGYRLARDAGKITAGDVIRALEGPLAPVSCLLDEDGEHCSMLSNCVTKELWRKMMEELNETADSFSISDLMKSYMCMNEADYIEYYI